MNNQFDALIIGGGVSGISCALVLGSAKNKNSKTILASQVNSISISMQYEF